MFKRDHHVRIATVLQSLNADFLLKHNCYFGGGTAIVLLHDEYRESIDIDFLVSDLESYRGLRNRLKTNGFEALLQKGAHLDLSREIRSDQYGIRTMLDVGGVNIKFEIVFEGRIELERPLAKDRICGVSTLTKLDMATSKLLANSDRWADDVIHSRDLIDLAMLELTSDMRKKAIKKAKSAYGASVEKDLKKAIEQLKDRPGRLTECMDALKMEQIPEAVLWKRIRDLVR